MEFCFGINSNVEEHCLDLIEIVHMCILFVVHGQETLVKYLLTPFCEAICFILTLSRIEIQSSVLKINECHM